MSARTRPSRTEKLSHAREPHGLSDDDALAVQYALSIFVGRFFNYSYPFCRIVGALTGIAGPGRTGAWPKTNSILDALEFAADDVAGRWLVAQSTTRRLDPELIAAFVPPRLWREVLVIIKGGPTEGWDRVRQLLRAWATGREVDGRPRVSAGRGGQTASPRGQLSEGSIKNMVGAFFAFMRGLDALRVLESGGRLALPPGGRLFGCWNADDLPSWPATDELGASPANVNREAPTLRLVRLQLQILSQEIEVLKRSAAGRRKLLEPLRDRALIGTLAVLGLRRHALNSLDTDDLQEGFAFPDNERGPAIVPRPGKTLSRHLERPKGIPQFLFDWIREYAEYVGIWGERGVPLWLSTDNPERARRKRMHDNSIYSIVARRFSREEAQSSRTPETYALRRAFLDEHDGRKYGPHNLRHLTEKLAFMVGLDWFDENRGQLLEQDAGLPAGPQIFPDALLDHAMPTMGDRYKDVASERGRLKWARKAALGVEAYLVGDKGARQGPDLATIREKQGAFISAQKRQAEAEERLHALEERLLSGGETLDVRELMLGNIQMARFARELGALSTATERARAAVESARVALVPVPDHLTRAEYESLVESGSDIEPEAQAEEDAADDEVPVVRDWASLDEFRWALGGPSAVSAGTLRRWARGQHTTLGKILGLPEESNGGRPRCVRRISERKQRILLSELDWSRLPICVQENLEVIRRTDPGEILIVTNL